MAMPIIAFRVDASPAIGSGHISRCLTLANSLRERGAASVFISRVMPKELTAIIAAHGSEFAMLPPAASASSAFPGMLHADFLACSQEEDAEATKNALASYASVRTLIVDHYGICRAWDQRFYESYRIIKIDDLADRSHLCHVLIDQNLYLGFDSRYDLLVPEGGVKLLGPEFALLKPNFSMARSKLNPVNNCIGKILVSSGGSDCRGIGLKVSQALIENTECKVALVGAWSSDCHRDYRRLIDKAQGRFDAPGRVDNMAEYLMDSDLFVGACGSTTWERLACGVPGVVYSLAENQVRLARDLHEMQLHRYLGPIESFSRSALLKEVEFYSDANLRSLIRSRSSNLVDGHGTSRVIAALGLAP